MEFKTTPEFANFLDEQDSLRNFREDFYIPKTPRPVHYFCGHSLGLMPKMAQDDLQDFLEDWKNFGVHGHFEGTRPWYSYHEQLSDSMGKIVGGLAEEVIVMNSLTVNLHLMLSTFWRPIMSSQKTKILIEEDCFPSDLYAIQSHIQQRGLNPKEHIIYMPLPEGCDVYSEDYIFDFIQKHSDETFLIFLGGVQFKTGQLLPMKEISKLAKKWDIIVGFDLAHAAGNVPLELHNWGVDFGIWCTYKYLNSGPGGVGGAFIHEKWASRKDLPRLGGWWGHNKDTRFSMGKSFEPMPSAEGWQVSNPAILPMVTLLSSLNIFKKAGGMEAIRAKSILLTDYLEFLLERLPGEEIQIATPKNSVGRGAQLSMRFSRDAKEKLSKLQDKDIVVDFRPPSILRAAPVPLYNSFNDVYTLAINLKKV